ANEINAMGDPFWNASWIEPHTGPGTGGIEGMSNLRDGLYKTIDYLEAVPHENMRTKAIIVFTDGLYNYYGNPLGRGRGTALRTKIASVTCFSGICTGAGLNPYNPTLVNTYEEDGMWWEGSDCASGSCYIPYSDYTFYNEVMENHANGGWLNFTGLKWNGMDHAGDPAHIAFPTFTGSGKSHYGFWPARYGCTGCAQCGYIHCDENINPAQYQLDVCAPEWPYIDGSGVAHGNCEQTKQNMTVFARDSNIRLYMVVIRPDADTDTSMPASASNADNMAKFLAYTTGGKYYPVHDMTDLNAAIDDITRDLASAATKDLTLEIDDTSVDLNSILTANSADQVFSHQHIAGISTTVKTWDQNGVVLKPLATIPEAQDWGSTHKLTYFVDDLDVGDTFQMNYTVQVNARGHINAIGPDSKVIFKDGYTETVRPAYIDVENAPPVFDEVEDQEVDLGETLSFQVSATDADSDPLTYAAASIPQGATFDLDTLTFEWAPTSRGTYLASFTVTDGMASDTLAVPITVTDLRPRIIIR
ncbi:MAG: putative Ig domain-containing protein, partial [Methanomicrobiales archaeon]|nr:putative Ig domain-containing protein [Methanomicrobiales archaeon]